MADDSCQLILDRVPPSLCARPDAVVWPGRPCTLVSLQLQLILELRDAQSFQPAAGAFS